MTSFVGIWSWCACSSVCCFLDASTGIGNKTATTKLWLQLVIFRIRIFYDIFTNLYYQLNSMPPVHPVTQTDLHLSETKNRNIESKRQIKAKVHCAQHVVYVCVCALCGKNLHFKSIRKRRLYHRIKAPKEEGMRIDDANVLRLLHWNFWIINECEITFYINRLVCVARVRARLLRHVIWSFFLWFLARVCVRMRERFAVEWEMLHKYVLLALFTQEK